MPSQAGMGTTLFPCICSLTFLYYFEGGGKLMACFWEVSGSISDVASNVRPNLELLFQMGVFICPLDFPEATRRR